jgi:hypothetical protein|tara:strand:+ start:333 stop:752 length:420 start_codon:yes stop_codon:yes gene_type:complete
MSDWYKLDENKNITKCAPGEGTDREGWQVARDQTNNGEVSTVFLGLDHSINGGTPVVFETLVMGGTHDQKMDRYTTWAEAEEGHRQMVKTVTLSKNSKINLGRRNQFIQLVEELHIQKNNPVDYRDAVGCLYQAIFFNK